MTAIGVDRLFALLLKMRYRQVETQECWSGRRRLLLVPEHCGQPVGVWRQACLPQFKLYLSVTECSDTNNLLPENLFHTSSAERTQVHVQDVSQPKNRNNPQTGTTYKRTVSSALLFHLVLISCYLLYAVVSLRSSRDFARECFCFECCAA